MSFFDWFFHRTKTTPFDPGEKTFTAGLDQQALAVRNYLADSAYQFPKDEEEDVRLNFQHHGLYHGIGSHYVAPISPPMLALAPGSGPKQWRVNSPPPW
jgi:hypothetical protein